jgi:hypothetical protein
MGLKVERCCIYRTNNDEFWRHGAKSLNVRRVGQGQWSYLALWRR